MSSATNRIKESVIVKTVRQARIKRIRNLLEMCGFDIHKLIFVDAHTELDLSRFEKAAYSGAYWNLFTKFNMGEAKKENVPPDVVMTKLIRVESAAEHKTYDYYLIN